MDPLSGAPQAYPSAPGMYDRRHRRMGTPSINQWCEYLPNQQYLLAVLLESCISSTLVGNVSPYRARRSL